MFNILPFCSMIVAPFMRVIFFVLMSFVLCGPFGLDILNHDLFCFVCNIFVFKVSSIFMI